MDARNWSLSKKLYHGAIAAACGFLCPFGSSVYTPATDQIKAEFNVSSEVARLPFVLYLLFLAFGPILAAPISETLGRRSVYLTGLPLLAVVSLGAGFSNSIVTLSILRSFAGLFASPGLSIGTGVIADLWAPEQRMIPMSTYVFLVQLGPALGPLIGGFVVTNIGWRWTQWIFSAAAAGLFLAVLGMQETYQRVIDRRTSDKEAAGTTKAIFSILNADFFRRVLLRPLHMLATEIIVLLLDIYVAVNFGLLNGFFAAFPYVFETQYSFGVVSVGLTFLGQAVGSLLGAIAAVTMSYTILASRNQKFKAAGKSAPPELRLPYAFVGGPIMVFSLFFFAWTARPSIPWIVPVVAEGLFSFGNLLIFLSATLYLTDAYGAIYGASASSSNTFLRYLVSAAFPLFIVQMYQALGVGWATSLLGFVQVLLVPIPFAFYVWGPQLRSKSRYAPDVSR